MASPLLDRFKLLVFSKGEECPLCNVQLKTLRELAPEFGMANIELSVIYPNVEPVEGITTVYDPQYELFKQLGIWDNFSNEPLHGLILIDSQRRVRWQTIDEHAELNLRFVLDEARRLMRIEP